MRPLRHSKVCPEQKLPAHVTVPTGAWLRVALEPGKSKVGMPAEDVRTAVGIPDLESCGFLVLRLAALYMLVDPQPLTNSTAVQMAF